MTAATSGPPQPLADRIGILQGRLVPSSSGELQCSPGARWPEEFALAASVGMGHLELLAERVRDPANPIWSEESRRALAARATATGVAAASLCVNEPLDVPFTGDGVADDLADRLVPAVDAVGVEIVVLPLFEASHLGDLDQAVAAVAVRRLADRLHEAAARLVLECFVPASEAAAFMDRVASEHVGLCYDLGNTTGLGFDTTAELTMLGSRVWHVHAKDKDDQQQNVRFGTGRVRFGEAMAALAGAGYDGRFTIEATRGDDPVATASEHRSFLLAAAGRDERP